MEILVELVGELLVGLGLVGLAYAVGSVVFLLVRSARLLLGRLDPAPDVVDPAGRRWVVRVGLAPAPLRYRMSRWMFRMRPGDRTRRAAGGDLSPDMVDRKEIAHPSGLVEQFDEAAGLVVWAVLAVTLVAIVLLALEIVLVAVLAVVVLVARTITSQWQCELVDPAGQRFHVPAGSVARARAQRDRLRQEIAAGVYPVRPPAATADHTW